MSKAQPDPATVWVIANGSLENASCASCGNRIVRAVVADRHMPWWHLHSGRVTCKEEGKTK